MDIVKYFFVLKKSLGVYGKRCVYLNDKWKRNFYKYICKKIKYNNFFNKIYVKLFWVYIKLLCFCILIILCYLIFM